MAEVNSQVTDEITGTGDGGVVESVFRAAIPRRPDLHFWRCQFERILTIALFVYLIEKALTIAVDHPMANSLREWAALVLGALLMGMRSTWKDKKEDREEDTPKERRDGHTVQ